MAVATAEPAYARNRWTPLASLRRFMPTGGKLHEEAWQGRHRGVLILLYAHALGLFAFGVARGYDPGHVALESSFIVALTLLASVERFGRRARAAIATLGLVSTSGILVHLSGGYIEAHFHFFVMLGVISLYQDWVPFSLSVVYVAIHHATVGLLEPRSVFNHGAAIEQPVLWASIHAVFVLGLSVANLITWRATEAAAAQRDHAEKENQRNLSLLTATLESTADGILVVDRNGRIAGHNRRFGTMWRIPSAVLAQKDDQAAIGYVLGQLKDPAGFLRKVQDLYDSEEESFDILEFKDGRAFERYSQPQRIEGKIVGRVWSFRDVTERRRAEREKLDSHARLAELERLKELDSFKTRFINSAAHELNTPLTPMRIQLHLLDKDKGVNLTPSQQEALRILHRNFERFDRLVQDVVNSARIQAGRLGIAKEPMDLAKLARDAAASFEAHAKEAGIAVEVDAPETLPLEGDAERLTQVTYNLINNALKFTPRGGSLKLKLERGPATATMLVADTGTGLTPEQIMGLFQPFSQVHDTSKTRTGSGLGLYISRSIVEMHGGRIWAESSGAGRGSTFCVELPVQGAAG